MSQEYINQAQIDAVKAEVGKIFPEIRSFSIGCYSPDHRKADTFSISVQEKGNKKGIEELKKLGFRRSYRQLKGLPGYDPCFYLNDERKYYVTMTKEL